MKVSIDPTKCSMCATCVALCPEVFEIKDDGTTDVKPEYKGVDITDAQLTEKIKEAVNSCPSIAIVIEE